MGEGAGAVSRLGEVMRLVGRDTGPHAHAWMHRSMWGRGAGVGVGGRGRRRNGMHGGRWRGRYTVSIVVLCTFRRHDEGQV